MKNNLTHLYLLGITLVVCWGRNVPTSFSEAKAKVNCPSFLQDDPLVPCWTLGPNAKCYCFSRTKRLGWRGANEFCRGGGTTLLSLETYEEDMLISKHIKGTSSPELLDDYYWTSGRYSQEGNKRWEWAAIEPFQPMTYTNWYPGSPSNNAPGSYAYVNYLFDNGVWFDMANTTSILFICESIDGSTTTTERTTTESTTPDTTTESTTTESTTTESTTTESTTTESTTTESTTTESTTTESTTTESTTTERTTESTTTESTTTESTTTERTTESTTTESTTTGSTTTVVVVQLTINDMSGFTCLAPNGNFEISGNCTSFYNCTNGQYTIQNCPAGTAFNPSVGACDFPFNVPGCSVVKAIETENSRLLHVDHSFRCPGNGNWPHPVHCHYFYTCYDHHLGAEPAQLWQCEKDFLYDVRHRKCRFSKNIVCGNRLQPKKH